MSMLSRFASLTTPGNQIQYVGGYVTSFIGNTSDQIITFGGNLTGGIASSASANDMVIVYFATGSTVDRNLVVAGYTEIVELYSDDNVDTNLAAAYKFMTSTPDTTVTLTGGSLATADAGAVAIQVWRNVDPNIIFDATTTTATGQNSVLCNPPSITPVTSGSVIVSGGAGGHNQGINTFSSSDLTNFLSSGQDDNNDVTVGLGYKVWTSGAFDPAAFTFSGTSAATHSWAAITLALFNKNPPANLLPTFVANSAVVESTTASLVLNKPTGTQNNDVMIAFIYCDSTKTCTPPAGWNEVLEFTGNMLGYAAWKTASNEGSNYTFTLSSSGTVSGFIVTYRNATFDVVGTGQESVVGLSITPTVNYSSLLSFSVDDNTSLTSASLSGWTQRFIFPAGNNSVALFTKDIVGAIATGNIATVADTGSAKEFSVLVSLKPN